MELNDEQKNGLLRTDTNTIRTVIIHTHIGQILTFEAYKVQKVSCGAFRHKKTFHTIFPHIYVCVCVSPNQGPVHSN